jgi:6-methylsalicylate decarboxylase
MDTVDVHQHLLSEPLISELSRRQQAPRLLQRRGGWTFRVAAEPDSFLPVEATDIEARWARLRRDGIDHALLSLSAALGVETLPPEEAAPLLEAHHRGMEVLPARFGGWGAVQLLEPDPAEVDASLARGCAGISLPASALATPAALERVGPLLERLEAREAPLFVHPGPVAGPRRAGASLPGWWPALTDYVAQMQAAWFAFLEAGRGSHPRLRVLFAMFAGGAPLQLERYASRSGEPIPGPDPLLFYDTSSYGPRMLAAVVAAVGEDQLVYGSDRPVVDAQAPDLDAAFGRALVSANPHRLLATHGKETADVRAHRGRAKAA